MSRFGDLTADPDVTPGTTHWRDSQRLTTPCRLWPWTTVAALLTGCGTCSWRRIMKALSLTKAQDDRIERKDLGGKHGR